MQTINTLPKQDGFRMPGEFEPHAKSWMAWPARRDQWYNNALPAQKAFAEVAIALSEFEPVTMCVLESEYANAREMLPQKIEVVKIPYDDAWTRDIGPTFVTNGRQVRGIDWEFNSWGGYLPTWELDNRFAQKVLEQENLDRYHCPMVLEGGSVHSDGEGTILAVEECLLNKNRNPQLSKQQIETNLKNYLNAEVIIWLSKGVYMDTVGGHVDNMCCFVKPGVVALAWTDDKNDPQFEISNDAFERLSSAIDAKGRRLEVHKIHQPDPLFITQEETEGLTLVKGDTLYHAGERMAASYLNFYIANGGVLIPGLGDLKHDRQAKEDIQKIFPDKKVVQIYSRDILLGGGNIHCITQQQPVAR